MLRPKSKQFKNDVGAFTKLYLTKACLTHTSNKVFHPTVRCLETLNFVFKLALNWFQKILFHTKRKALTNIHACL